METRLAIPLKNYGKRQSPNPEIHRFALSVCLFVCLCPIKVMTAEPIRPNFFCSNSHDPTGWFIDELMKKNAG